MKLEKWALIAEIGGALAVVLSVIYLAVEVSDNTRILRSQAHYNALELTQRPIGFNALSFRLVFAGRHCDGVAESKRVELKHANPQRLE
jgi:hypothetical protein